MQGKLFTRDFLEQGIRETDAWRALDDERVAAFGDELRRLFAAFPVAGQPNEAATEQDLIRPVLRALGWHHDLPQQTASGTHRTDVPDLLLFADAGTKQAANAERDEADRFRHGIAIVESKRWQRPLDRGEAREAFDSGTPSAQILRYLSRADVLSGGRIRWGLLTNGRLWRLYWQGARSRTEEFFETDLAVLSGIPGVQPELEAPEATRRDHFLRVVLLLLRREAFLPDPADRDGRTFLEIAQEESRRWELRVSQDLGERVFQEIFPGLLHALIRHDPQAPATLDVAYLDEVRRAGLTFLYRLLFVLYAEDRNLLPTHDQRYDDYSLHRVRNDVAERLDRGDALSNHQPRYHQDLTNLFTAIGEGDDGIGLPPYDGGLFEPGRHALLERVRLPDAVLAPLLDDLSRRYEAGERRWINYRDLSVQHLGSIYERLLEYEPVLGDDGRVELAPNVYARKGSGSYYTHDDLVRLILAETVGPLVAEIDTAFDEAVERLRSERRPRAARLAELVRHDPANGILGLQICDPAMGSGHFLVSLVDYLADAVLERIARAEDAVDWAGEEAPYRSPVTERTAVIRQRILEAAHAERWAVDEAQLDDRHIVRRILLKRVVYGVDKNPMAVELAKVSLWLHTFTAGAPLSFVDHHLRCGDSLYGEWLDAMVAEFDRFGALWFGQARAEVVNASKTFQELARIDDTDIAEVQHSRELFQQGDAALARLRHLLDLWQTLRWIDPASRLPPEERHPGSGPLLRGIFGDPREVIAAGNVTAINPEQADEAQAVNDLLAMVHELVARERFLHWELAFPDVWKHLDRPERGGGFDAVIGNPPWDRLKLQEVEWFAARRPEIARQARAADRKAAIARLERQDAPLWRQYLAARDAAETASEVARRSGDYPQLSRGDVNIYSLFVERAERLIRPRGVVGLLVPSGIASDLSAAQFFSAVATGGRLGALLDFENKKVFFPEVHASFKFSVLVFGGEERQFAEARCAFFLHRVDELDDPQRSFPLGPADFAAVNPNTGTAPIFRNRRDATITTGIYERLPVLVDRRNGGERAAWPVRYVTMFHMTNDSGLFRTGDELEALGAYRVMGNRWRRGGEEWVPLYEGKMVQMYDHRAASIEVRPGNVHRAAQPVPAGEEERADPHWLPEPQYWVAREQVAASPGLAWAVAYKDVTAPTNVRTMIAAAVPAYGLGNTLPAFLPAARTADAVTTYRSQAPLLLASLNSFAYDYLARQKVQGQHLNLYIVEQLPVLPPAIFAQHLGGHQLGDFVREQVLRLTYTAVDMAPFARDLGFEGEPFPWDDEDRRHRMARLDALFFHLYGLDRADAGYVLDQFPIVRRNDEAAFGRYRTRLLVLEYMKAVAAGDLETVVSG